jgi:hypothetical protein
LKPTSALRNPISRLLFTKRQIPFFLFVAISRERSLQIFATGAAVVQLQPLESLDFTEQV